jgi:uncharacterized protein YjbI with pentapeptide repeats
MSAIITIKTHDTAETLYQGAFSTMRETLECAIRENVSLDNADLQGANLTNAMLDDAKLRGARFDHANLQGANLSESQMDGANFFNAALYNACFCGSSLRGALFDGADFGGTDVAGATLDGSIFSTLSAFALNFTGAASLQDCYWKDGAMLCNFSKPPLVVSGLDYPLAVFDAHIKIGSLVMAHDAAQDFIAALMRGIRREERHNVAQRMDSRLFTFLSAHTGLIAALLGVDHTVSLPAKIAERNVALR